MSTELKSIQGKIEIPNLKTRESDYKHTELHLTKFYGGTNRSTSLQIGFYNDLGIYNHIQLDSKAIKELKDLLNDEFPNS